MSEAKAHLQKISRKRYQIRYLTERIRQLSEMVYDPLKAVTYDRDVVQVSHTGTEGTDKIVELADLKGRLSNLKAQLEISIDQARSEIWLLPTDKYMELLSMIYLEGMSLQEAADDMGKSYDWAKKAHGRALQEFQSVVLDPRKGGIKYE